MTRLGLRPYQAGDDPPPGSVPVSVVVLTLNEEPNIRRCLASVAWADQVVVVDSGSADGTVPVARSLGAEVVEQPWLGFSAQRECSLRLPLIRHDWVYFVDADEWVSPQLAAEIAIQLADPDAPGSRTGCALCSWAPGSAIAAGTQAPGSSGLSTGVTPSTTGAWWASEPAWTGGSGGWTTTSWTRTAMAWPPGCTSTCVTRNWSASSAATSAACRNGCARCGTAAVLARSPAHPQGAGLPRHPGQACRALSLHVHRQARLPRRRGRAPLLLLPRVVRDERGVAPGGSPWRRGEVP